MKLIIKGKNIKMSPEIKEYVEERVLKYESMVEEPAVCEVMLINAGGPKGGKDKVVHIVLTMPGTKRPIFARERTDDFFGSIDLVQERLEHQILKYKERKKIGSRFPVKYWVAKMFETGKAGPRWLVKKIKRR